MSQIIRNGKVLLAVLTGMLFVTSALSAQTPRKQSQIPVFPGARVIESPDKASDDDTISVHSLYHNQRSMRLRNKTATFYEVAATPEEVFVFYRKALGGKHDDNATEKDKDYQSLAAGGTTTVLHSYLEIDPDQTFNKYSSNTRRPTLKRVGRAPLPGTDKWIQAGGFSWMVREANDDITILSISFNDEGFTNELQNYTKKTSLEIHRSTYMTYEAAMAADAAKEKAEHESKTDALMPAFEKAPTEATLGVVVYPGATYDARSSASLSTDETRAFVFLSNAATDVVAKFYQAKTGKQPTSAGAYIIFALKGAMPQPEHAVIVQPNKGDLPGPAKTIITVMHAK